MFRQTLTGYVTLPLLAIGIAGSVLALRRHLRLAVVYLTWTIVPTVGAIFFTTYPFPRHFMSSLPPFLVLIAYAVVLGWQMGLRPEVADSRASGVRGGRRARAHPGGAVRRARAGPPGHGPLSELR